MDFFTHFYCFLVALSQFSFWTQIQNKICTRTDDEKWIEYVEVKGERFTNATMKKTTCTLNLVSQMLFVWLLWFFIFFGKSLTKRENLFYSWNKQKEKKTHTCPSVRSSNQFQMFRFFSFWIWWTIISFWFSQTVSIWGVCVDNGNNCWYDNEARVCLGARLASYRVKQRLLHVATFYSQTISGETELKKNTHAHYVMACVCIVLCTICDCLFFHCDNNNMKIRFFPFTWKI